MHILLVDDDPDCRMLIRDALGEAQIDCHVHEAGTVAEALDFLCRRVPQGDAPRPDLVYLDLQLPHSSGLDVLAEVRSDPELAEVPIVMITGCQDAWAISRAYQLGANCYMFKAPNLETFMRSIALATAYWLDLAQRRPVSVIR